MRLRLALASLAVLAFASTALAAPPAAKGMWDGFGEGSSVETKTTTKMEMPGATMPDQVSEARQTLVKVTDDAWTVKMETKTGDAWGNANEIQIPRKVTGTPGTTDAPKPEDLGTETVTVEGKDYPCKKIRVKAGGSTTTTWMNDEQGMLKSETEMSGTTSSLVVTALAKKVTVAGKEITCREMKQTSKMAQGEMQSTMLTSDEVPTHTVRMESTMSAGPMKTVTTMEVVAVDKK